MVVESLSHGIGKGWGADGGKVRCSMSLSCSMLVGAFPSLLHLFCFLQMCSTDKDPYITCKLLCYFCSLMLFTALPFPPFMGLFLFFSCRVLSPGITFAGISVLSTGWSAVLSSYPECWCHISPTWCIRILILSGPTHDLSLFSKLRCDCEGLNSWSLLAPPEKLNWDALLYFAVVSLEGRDLNSCLDRWLPARCLLF